ncbi:MAG TPA: sigma-54 dependent transcriptional regulator [Candidatus Sulfotelmatobacter sp.]|nr:sigma-54 dependent transcriptional regulator [Candidatus Sulfotelmatobacter sp.]
MRSGRLTPWNPIPPDGVLFGKSPAMAELRNRAQRICSANIPVLLTGEGGTGKEALARWFHAHSRHAGGEFVKVNCAAIPGALLESELFGYERGAFTGATYSKPGRVELADHGTLFLDEIADLDLHLQSKLLHFLQDSTFSRIGDNTERKIEVRLLCATNKDLQTETAEGRFRQDLFYRIHVFRLALPTLRDRREDIPMLAEYFRQHFESQFGIAREPFSQEMLDYLQNLKWPGNIRELSNVVARYVLIGPDGMIESESNPKHHRARVAIDQDGSRVTLKRVAKDAIKELERSVILETLRANQWNRRKTAQELKISYRALIYKIQDAGLISRRSAAARSTQPPQDFRPGSGSDD